MPRAKAGLTRFSRAVVVKNARRGVRLDCLPPWLIEKKFACQIASRETGTDRDAFFRRRHEQVSMRRMVEAFEVVEAALFLASGAAMYITGTEILVDGGLCATLRN